MKKFSQLTKAINESKQLSIQDDSVNKLNPDELKTYVSVASKFLSEETKNICKWLAANEKYADELPNADGDNALASFFNSGFPKEAKYQDLYRWILAVVKSGRILEIPVFLTREQFDAIVSKKAAPDEYILDLETEAGKNEVAKRYIPLVHKIANSWIGKSALTKDELFSYGLEGLELAMRTYGKKRPTLLKKEKELGIEIDTSKYRSTTFLQFASQIIRNMILEGIKNHSHLVRIPISRQRKEKEEKGYVAKSNSVSGDTHLGSKDGGEGKTLFDLVGGMENPGKAMDKAEIDRLWDEIMKDLSAKFSEQTMDIFKNHFGFDLKDGEKKLSGKEMAKKYGYSSPSSITAEITKVLNFIKKDKKMFQKFVDIFELMQEAKHDDDEYDTDNEPIYLSAKLRDDALNPIKENDSYD